MISFQDWLQQHDESSPATRKKMGVLMGQYPAPTDAEMLGGHSTFPWYDEYKKGTAFKGGTKKKKAAKKSPKKSGQSKKN